VPTKNNLLRIKKTATSWSRVEPMTLNSFLMSFVVLYQTDNIQEINELV
jgi:hypothetical protein